MLGCWDVEGCWRMLGDVGGCWGVLGNVGGVLEEELAGSLGGFLGLVVSQHERLRLGIEIKTITTK